MSKDRIAPYLPTEGLFADFLEYTSGGEDCPRFRFFSFASAIGSIIRRKVWFQRSSKTVFPTLYPNLWIVLVAPQGIGHKSSALRMSKNFLDKLPENIKPKMLASKLTPEALVRALASKNVDMTMLKTKDPGILEILKRKAQGLIYSSEFGVLLGKQKYNTGMIELLTHLYDCDDEFTSETIMRGDETMVEICISIMGASTPDWMQTMLPADAFKGGFMSRLLLIGFPDGWHVRVADPDPPPAHLFQKIMEQLIRIGEVSGEIVWTEEARDFFNSWYEGLPEPTPGVRQAYLERKQDHLLKLSIVLQLAKSTNLVLEASSIRQALDILNACEYETLKMVDYISIEPRMRIVQRIVEVLEASSEGISEAELLQQVWGYLSRSAEFDEVIGMLFKAKKVKMVAKGTDIMYEYVKEARK